MLNLYNTTHTFCRLHNGLQSPIQNMWTLLFFHGKICCAKAPQCYVTLTWCVLFVRAREIVCHVFIVLQLRLYSTYSSFLVINVCNQGKTLCSPCIIRRILFAGCMTVYNHPFRTCDAYCFSMVKFFARKRLSMLRYIDMVRLVRTR